MSRSTIFVAAAPEDTFCWPVIRLPSTTTWTVSGAPLRTAPPPDAAGPPEPRGVAGEGGHGLLGVGEAGELAALEQPGAVRAMRGKETRGPWQTPPTSWPGRPGWPHTARRASDARRDPASGHGRRRRTARHIVPAYVFELDRPGEHVTHGLQERLLAVDEVLVVVVIAEIPAERGSALTPPGVATSTSRPRR